MMVGLRRELLRRPSIQTFEDFVATRLLMDGERIAGAVAMNLRTAEMVVFEARAVVMATGGYEEVMEFTDTEPGASGDGTALALHAGAEMVDLEMMLFYPTCLVWPDEVEGTLVQYEGLMGPRYLAGKMVNVLGDEFLPQIEERYVLPVRDIMMKAMFKEIDEGRGTPHGGVYIDLRKSPRSRDEIFSMLHTLDSLPYQELRDLGVDIMSEPIEVKPGTHYCLGGIRINERTESNVPGLYAAGEVAGNIHGANRTSGNALAETQVFGARAGQYAAEYVAGTSQPTVDGEAVAQEIGRLRTFMDDRPDAIRPITIRKQLKSVMQEHMAHRRNEAGMTECLRTIQRLRDEDLPRMRAQSNPPYVLEWQDALEVGNMLDVAEAAVRSALLRTESRGHHFPLRLPRRRRGMAASHDSSQDHRWRSDPRHRARCSSEGSSGSGSRMSDEKVIVHIERLDPEIENDSHWETFEVPYERRHSVLTLLNYIYEHHDATLGYRNYICGRGLCNSCRVKIDGKIRKGCATPVAAGEEIYVRPCSEYVDQRPRDCADRWPRGASHPRRVAARAGPGSARLRRTR